MQYYLDIGRPIRRLAPGLRRTAFSQEGISMPAMISPSLSRRSLLLGAAPAIGLLTLPAQARTPPLDFVVIGDWGRRGKWQQREVAREMGRSAAAIGSRFVVSVGDNFYQDGVASVADPQWQSSFERIYTDPALLTKWHVILGNHDYQGDVAAQLAYSAGSPRWSLPAPYYTRTEVLADGTSVEFFHLDTSRYIREYRHHPEVRVQGQDKQAQIDWLERGLASSKAAWKIVIGHHQLYTVMGQNYDFPEMIGPFKPLLDRYGVRAYINGHEHNLQHVVVDGVHYITCGAGSATTPVVPAPPGQFSSDHHGFMTMRLEAEALGFRFIDDTGATLFQASIPRQA
jgi:tartrate-resistant acid phosphatase type 5